MLPLVRLTSMLAMLTDPFISPFVEFAFMRHALAGAVLLSASAGPLGVFLTLRRLSLAGDALSHALLPGVAFGFLLAGLNIWAMALGGLGAGLLVALLSGAASRLTGQKEDSSLAAFYLVSLALGVLLISLRGSAVDLNHILFGTVLALDAPALVLVAGVASFTLLALAIFWRALVLECLDPQFFRAVGGQGPLAHAALLVLLVLNLVGGFQALGTLLAVGLMMLPAAAARFWVQRLEPMCLLATAIAMASSYLGLVAAYAADVAAGPAIVLMAGLFYFASLVFSPRGLMAAHLRSRQHKVA